MAKAETAVQAGTVVQDAPKAKIAPLALGENHKVVSVPLASIKVNWDNNLRTQLEAEEGLAVLKAAIQNTGKRMVDPLLVRATSKEGVYNLEDGFRRYLVCESLHIKEVPVYVIPAEADKLDVDILKLSLNSQEARHDINPISRLEGYLALIEKCQKRGDQNVMERIRKSSGASKKNWESLMQLKDAPAQVKIAVKEGRMSLSAALAFLDKASDEWIDDKSVTAIMAELPKKEVSVNDAKDTIRSFFASQEKVEDNKTPVTDQSELDAGAAKNALAYYLGDSHAPAGKDYEAVLNKLSETILSFPDVSVSFYEEVGGKKVLKPAMLIGFVAGAIWAKKGSIPPPMACLEDETISLKERTTMTRRQVEYEILGRIVNATKAAGAIAKEDVDLAYEVIDGTPANEETNTAKGKGLVDTAGSLSDHWAELEKHLTDASEAFEVANKAKSDKKSTKSEKAEKTEETEG